MTAPRRILALSGGGLRGIVEVAFLEAIEAEYRRRHGPGQICDWFDLIGGTSTGALIATALALGKPLSDIRDFYLIRAKDFFADRRWWKYGLAPVFDCAGLERELRHDVGGLRLGDPAFRTRLAIVTKRLDTGAPWIVSNIPTSPYFNDGPDGQWIGNRHFEVARLLRAASAAPTLFSHQELEIVQGQPPGVFVDGGLSVYNDPSLALLRLARLRAFGLNWPLGPENLFILSLGTGRLRARVPLHRVRNTSAFMHAVRSLLGVSADGDQVSLTMMEWMGTSPSPSQIDSEIGTLAGEHLAGDPLFTFLRLDLSLETDDLRALGHDPARISLNSLRAIDRPEAIAPLYDLTRAHIKRHVDLENWLI